MAIEKISNQLLQLYAYIKRSAARKEESEDRDDAIKELISLEQRFPKLQTAYSKSRFSKDLDLKPPTSDERFIPIKVLSRYPKLKARAERGVDNEQLIARRKMAELEAEYQNLADLFSVSEEVDVKPQKIDPFRSEIYREFFSSTTQLFRNRQYKEAAFDICNFLIETYLSRNQLIRLFSLSSYSDITHDLYYHIGKLYKKRYFSAKSQLYKESKEEFGYSLAVKTNLETFLSENQVQVRTKIGIQYKETMRVKYEWQGVFELIRGDTQAANTFRQGVSRFAKMLLRGEYVYPKMPQVVSQPLFDQFQSFLKYKDKEVGNA